MRIYPYQLCEALQPVFFHSKGLFLCCPVDGGLTYRPTTEKVTPLGNFGGSGVQPQAIRQNQEDGYCSHGLDPNCCPLGCGDI